MTLDTQTQQLWLRRPSRRRVLTSIHYAAIVLAAVACATDLRDGRIPNALTFGSLALALIVHGLLPQGLGWTHALLGLLAGGAVFFPFFALGGMGAGDVKLMAALGAWMGWQPALFIAMYGAVRGCPRHHRGARDGLSAPGVLQSRTLADALAHGRDPAAAGSHPGTFARPSPRVCDSHFYRAAGDVMAIVKRFAPRLRARTALLSERGAELIEFAIVLPVMLLIVMGIVDFGFMFQRYVVLTNAAMEGARVAVLPGYSTTDVEDRVRAYAAGGGIAGTVTPSVVNVNLPAPSGTWPGKEVTVTHAYGFNYLGPIASMFGGGSRTVTLTARSTMRSQISTSP